MIKTISPLPESMADYVEDLHREHIIAFTGDFMEAIYSLESFSIQRVAGIHRMLKEVEDSGESKKLLQLFDALEAAVENLAYWEGTAENLALKVRELTRGIASFKESNYCHENIRDELLQFEELFLDNAENLVKVSSRRTQLERLVYLKLVRDLGFIVGDRTSWGPEATSVGNIFSSDLAKTADRQRLLDLFHRRDELVGEPTEAKLGAYVKALEAFRGLFPLIEFDEPEELKAELLVELLWLKKDL